MLQVDPLDKIDYTLFGLDVAISSSNRIVVSDAEDKVYVYDSETKDLVNTICVPEDIADNDPHFGSHVAATGNHVLVSSRYGIYKYDSDASDIKGVFLSPNLSRQRDELVHLGSVSSMFVMDDLLLVGPGIYAYNLETMELVSYIGPSDGQCFPIVLGGAAAGSDGVLIVGRSWINGQGRAYVINLGLSEDMEPRSDSVQIASLTVKVDASRTRHQDTFAIKGSSLDVSLSEFNRAETIQLTLNSETHDRLIFEEIVVTATGSHRKQKFKHKSSEAGSSLVLDFGDRTFHW